MGVLNYSAITISPSAVAANTAVEQIFALAGVDLAGSIVLAINKPSAQAGLGIVGWRVTSDGNIGITFANFTGGSITPTAAESYRVVWLRTARALPTSYQLPT